jgi:hypothetical protein
MSRVGGFVRQKDERLIAEALRKKRGAEENPCVLSFPSAPLR